MSDFLSRWSRRKAASREGAVPPAAEPPVAADAAPVRGNVAAAGVAPAQAGIQAPSSALPEPLPPLESLTPESDFAPFMQQGVDGSVRRTALKTLFADPRFNVMDGLDVYIDDYSKPDPLPEGWLEQLKQVERLGHWQPPAEPAPPDSAEAAAVAAVEPAAAVAAPGAAPDAGGESAPPQDSGSPPGDRIGDA